MRYDAFISYRHKPLDMEIAKKLHKGLETFKIPRSVQKNMRKRKLLEFSEIKKNYLSDLI